MVAILLNPMQFCCIWRRRQDFYQAILGNAAKCTSGYSFVSGVYLISDKLNGKLYVGSAYGKNCIWGRWETYFKNYHGGNDQLKELFMKKGKDYFYNFQYSILETCDINLSEKEVTNIESRWENILLTRKFGYNSN